MVTCEATESYKIPLKSCHNSFIDHHHVTICISVEWSDKGEDDAKLVVDITDKKPPISYVPPNQSSAPMLVNSVHQYHHRHQQQQHQQQQQQQQQQQENFHSMYHQQQYYHHHHHHQHLSSIPNNPDHPHSTTTTITAGDHNDGSSITATVLYDVIQPQGQPRILTPSARLQPNKTELKSQTSSSFRRQPTFNQQFLSPQHVIQTPTNMNETQLNMQMSTISQTTPLRQTSSITTHIHDLQQTPTMPYPSSTTATILQAKPVICSCLDPNHHGHSCPVITLTKQLNSNLNSQNIYPSTTTQRTNFIPRINSNDTISSSTTKEPILTAALLPTSNSMFIKTSNSTANFTTIVSQHAPFINNNSLVSPTIKPSLSNTDNNFQQESLIFPQVIVSQQANSQQSNPPGPIARQQNNIPIVPRLPKSRLLKQESLPNSDQSRNDAQPLNRLINKLNSPSRQQTPNTPSLLSSPVQLEQRLPLFQDNLQTMTNLSLANPLHGSTNDLTGRSAQQQQVAHPDSTVRSPVTFDFSVASDLTQSTVSPEEIDQAIDAVVKGEGTITVDKISSSTGSHQQQQQQQQKQSSSPRLVWEQNGPVTTKTYLSPLHQKQQQLLVNDSNTSTLTHQKVVNITPQVIRPSPIEQNEITTVRQPKQPATEIKKRIRPKSTNSASLKRTRKTSVNTSQPKTTPSVTATSTFFNEPQLSSSSDCTATIDTFNDNFNHDFNHSFWQASNIDFGNGIDPHSAIDDAAEQILESDRLYDFTLDDVFSSKTDLDLNVSTRLPPPSSSSPIRSFTQLADQLLTPASTGKLSTTSATTSDDFYEEFLHYILPTSSTWQENQAPSMILTPPDFPNNPSQQQQQHQTQTFECIDSDRQSQTQLLQTNSTPMNTTEDILTSSKPKAKSNQKKPLKNLSKVSKQKNRFNPTQKQTSTRSTCTNCGSTKLLDITQHEFPKQKGLVFECASCGNNSIQSNVSNGERRRRLNKVASDHLNRVECQFCHAIFHSHNDYLMHLKNDHASNKPM